MKHNKSILRIITVAITMIISLQVFSGNPVSEKQPKDKPVVAFLMDALYTDRWQKDKAYFEQFVKEAGARPIVKIANSDVAQQLKQAREAINEGAKVLVIVPSNLNKAAKIVEFAHKHDIKVVAYDRLINSNALDYYVAFDSKAVGKMQASFAVSRKPTGKYAIISGPKRDYNSLLIRRAAKKVLKPKLESGDINLVYDQHQGEWAEMEAYMTTTSILTMHPDIDAILAANDMFAIGANMALEENNLSGKVLLTGQDATVEAVQMLIDGSLDMTLYKPIESLAKKAADVAVNIAKGKSVNPPKTISVNGLTIDCWLLDIVKVTENNIRETVVKDGHIKASELKFD